MHVFWVEIKFWLILFFWFIVLNYRNGTYFLSCQNRTIWRPSEANFSKSGKLWKSFYRTQQWNKEITVWVWLSLGKSGSKKKQNGVEQRIRLSLRPLKMRNEWLHLKAGTKKLEKKEWIRNHESWSQFCAYLRDLRQFVRFLSDSEYSFDNDKLTSFIKAYQSNCLWFGCMQVICVIGKGMDYYFFEDHVVLDNPWNFGHLGLKYINSYEKHLFGSEGI